MKIRVKFKQVKQLEGDIDLDEVLYCFNITKEQWDNHSPSKQEQILSAYYENVVDDIMDNCFNTEYKIEIVNNKADGNK